MERGYKMRIYPNKEQAILINKTLGCSRFVFNQGLDNMKCRWYGRTFKKVPTFYPSSQTCHVCGYKHPYVKNLSIRNWECPNCRIIHDRDINAAMNILPKGLELIA